MTQLVIKFSYPDTGEIREHRVQNSPTAFELIFRREARYLSSNWYNRTEEFRVSISREEIA